MKLLKTLLLSTTFVMGTTFGAALDCRAHQSASTNTQIAEEEAAKVFLDSLQKIEEQQVEQANLIALIISFIDHNKTVEVNQANTSDQSVELLGELLNQIQALVAERNGLKTKLAGETEAKTELEVVKAAADEELEKLRAELEEANKTIVDKAAKLTAAKTKVDELTTDLEKVEIAAKEADETARREADQLTKDFQAANENATALAAEVKRITAKNAELTKYIERVKAHQQMLVSAKAEQAETNTKKLKLLIQKVEELKKQQEAANVPTSSSN